VQVWLTRYTISGMKTGPSIPTTELVLMPRPRTTVGYSSEAMSGRTTKEEEMPILPTQ
jgi:hypothetical protein